MPFTEQELQNYEFYQNLKQERNDRYEKFYEEAKSESDSTTRNHLLVKSYKEGYNRKYPIKTTLIKDKFLPGYMLPSYRLLDFFLRCFCRIIRLPRLKVRL